MVKVLSINTDCFSNFYNRTKRFSSLEQRIFFSIMQDVTKFRYKKSHLLFLNTYKATQLLQTRQRKTFESFILKAMLPTAVRYNEYEAVRRILSRKIFKLLRFNLFTKPYIPVTAKPREIRMGKGKGAYSHSHFTRTVGQRFAKVSWCHNQTMGPLVSAVKNSIKKSSQRIIL